MALEELIVPAVASGAIASAAVYLAWKLYSRCVVAVPPNRALVLFGRPVRADGHAPESDATGVGVGSPRIIIGGGQFVAPWRRGVGYLSLSPLDVEVSVRYPRAAREAGASEQQLLLHVEVKIPTDPEMLRRAAENLLYMTEEEVRALVRRAVEGVAPSVLVRRPSTEGEEDWERLAAEIEAAVAPNLVDSGLLVRSLSIKGLRPVPAVEENPSSAAPIPAAARELLRASGDLGTRLRALESRLDRTDRSLGDLVAEIVRMARDGSLFSGNPAFPADDPIGGDGSPGSPASASAEGERTGPGNRRTLWDAEQ